MKFKIEKDGYDRYRVYKKVLGFLWINLYYSESVNREYYNYSIDAEKALGHYCRRLRHSSAKSIVVKELDCKDFM